VHDAVRSPADGGRSWHCRRRRALRSPVGARTTTAGGTAAEATGLPGAKNGEGIARRTL